MATLHSCDGTRLAFHDFGGTGEPLLLLPGLCGYAGEWSATIEFLTATNHVFALDPRGHGDSDPHPADVSRAAHVADTTAALEEIGPATVIGQSLGGGLVGEAWANGLRQHPDGWRPPFHRDIMVDTIAAAADPRWPDFDRLTCPILVVKGSAGSMNANEFARMQNHPMVTAVEIPGAGHDVHLDSPSHWRAAVTTFLSNRCPQPEAAHPSTEISSE